MMTTLKRVTVDIYTEDSHYLIPCVHCDGSEHFVVVAWFCVQKSFGTCVCCCVLVVSSFFSRFFPFSEIEIEDMLNVKRNMYRLQTISFSLYIYYVENISNWTFWFNLLNG